MAHIADCMADADARSISKPDSPILPFDMRNQSSAVPEKLFTWRMQPPQQPPSQAPEQRRYQLFPRERQLPLLNQNKPAEAEKTTTIVATPKDDKTDKPFASTLRTKISQHSLIRRRKVSVPELGPMTTVHEVPMDSPTIPGRPPLHERSASAPADDWKQSPLSAPFYYPGTRDSLLSRAIEDAFTIGDSDPSYQQTSPKQLTPLVIPSSASRPPQLLSKRSITHMRSGSVPTEGYKARSGGSPGAKTPFAKTSMPDLTKSVPTSTTTATVAPLTTPISAPPLENYRSSPHPWEVRSNTPTLRSNTPTLRSNTPTAMERANTPTQRSPSSQGHRRGASSDTSTIMDRGRPRKRADGRPINGSISKKVDLGVDKVIEQKAFEELPVGLKPKDAIAYMSADDIMALQNQAIRQAERFEILKPEEVESLSKELRRLDERTDYLRRTYISLRAGRRNLHSRVCQLLRSPRVARFSPESMLKQEEALAELDASVDDWINKLEMAENRRTRVRQKLLEHVAAAAILPGANVASVVGDVLHQPPGVQCSPGPRDISTPPRSPSKVTTFFGRNANSSPSPQRVVTQVPSTILEHPVIVDDSEEAGEPQQDADQKSLAPTTLERADVESIRIYAGDDLYTLLADVENEITKMSKDASELDEASHGTFLNTDNDNEQQVKSRVMPTPLNTTMTLEINTKDLNSATPASPPAPTPPMKDYPPKPNPGLDNRVLLSSAVFKP